MTLIRPLALADAESLLELFRVNSSFLAPWQPLWSDDFLTLRGQRQRVGRLVRECELGQALPHVILDADRIIGRVTLSNIVRGPFQSCNLGYWVSAEANGRGHASAAVAQIVQLAFSDLRLHRVEAGTLTHNLASQRVLEHSGFERFGLAERYLQIAGAWQDHVLFQRLAPEPPR